MVGDFSVWWLFLPPGRKPRVSARTFAQYATHGVRWGGVGHDDVPCTCTHGRCYASHGLGWGGVGMMTFLALAHMCDATQLIGWGGGGDDVPCTCIHV